MTDWLTQDLFASIVALGAAVTVLRRVAEFASPVKNSAGCPSCGTPGKTCARPSNVVAASSIDTHSSAPLIQITRRAS